MLSTSSLYLTDSLRKVNDELQSSIDTELKRLKNEEKQLKEFLLLKTRRDLISTMSKELEMDELAKNNDALKNTFFNSNNLKESMTFSDNALTKSHLLYDKLNEKYLTETATSLNKSNDVLRQYLLSTNFGNQIDQQPVEPVKPNLVSIL
jgi:hypothetical protein